MKTVSIATWHTINDQIVSCDRCPRLRDYCQSVKAEKRAAYREWDYWGLPVPNFGDPSGRLLVVGLAPAAHGANRTGRMFTGDRSGDWLYRALHKAGFANQPTSIARDDGLELIDCTITSPCHCAPPENKPTPQEIGNCAEWFRRTIETLPVKVIVALGQIAWQTTVRQLCDMEWLNGSRPKFGHAVQVPFDQNRRWLIGSFHPSPHNTFTGRLTEPMFDAVFDAARTRIDD